MAPQKPVTNTTPAKKTAAAKKASPAKKAAPAKATPEKAAPPPESSAKNPEPPAKKAAPPEAPTINAGPSQAPAKKAAAAKKTSPLKHTLKAAAAEVAPGIVEPDMTTVPDEQTSGLEQPVPAAREAATEPTKPGVSTSRPSEAATSRPSEAATTGPSEAATTAEGIEASTSSTDLATSSTDMANAQPEHTEAWARLIADPGHSPELLALAAVQTMGPRAQEWAVRTREAYPNASPDGIARLASQQFVRFGTVSSVFAAVAGSYAPITLLGAAALAHAELSLHVAAAYGLDPADPARAADLLVLTRVHPTREDAEAALAAAREHSYEGSGITDAAWRLGRMVAVHAGGWTVLRAANRFFPGTSLLTAVLTSRAAARTVAARANLFYRTAGA